MAGTGTAWMTEMSIGRPWEAEGKVGREGTTALATSMDRQDGASGSTTG